MSIHNNILDSWMERPADGNELPPLILQTDSDGTVINWFAGGPKTAETEMKASTGRNLAEIAGERYSGNISGAIKKARLSGQSMIRFPRKNQGACQVNARFLKMTDDSLTVVFTFRCPDKAVRNELAIQDREEKYRLLAENISDVIWVYNLSADKFTYMSPSVYRLRGVPAEEAMRRKIDEGITPDSAEKIRQTLRDTSAEIAGGNIPDKTYINEIQIVKSDGTLLWIESSARYRRRPDGDIEILGVSRNIDERKKTEFRLRQYAEELKASEELFFRVFNESPVCMILSDPDTRVIRDVNDQLIKTLGISRESVVSKEFFSLGLDIHDNKAIELGRMIRSGIQIRDYEVNMTSPMGDVFTFLLNVDRIKLNDSVSLLTTAVDITRVKKVESKISRMLEQEKLTAAISKVLNKPGDLKIQLQEAIGMLGKFLKVSQVCLIEARDGADKIRQKFKWTCDRVRPANGQDLDDVTFNVRGIMELLDDRDIIQLLDISDRMVNLFPGYGQQEIRSILGCALKFEGTAGGFLLIIEIEKDRQWLPDETDLIKNISGIIASSLQRNAIVEQLEFSNLRLNLAIESANEGLWDWNNETNQVYINDRCSTMLGYVDGEIVFDSQSYLQHVHPDDRKRVAGELEKHFRGETERYNSSYRLRTKDGSWKWILDHGRVVHKDNTGKPARFVGTRLDISDQKETELKLQQLVETQDKLFSIIAHDLRGPIGSFNQGLELLTNGTVRDENLKRRLLEELRKTSQTTYRLLENLLNWSITKASTMKIEPEPLKLKQLIDENLKLLAAYTMQKSISIRVNADDKLVAYADRDSVNLVIRNLLNNAVKFTPTMGTVTVSAHDSGRQIELNVEDTGVGMSSDILNNLFKINSYNSMPGTNKEKGAGIGLVLCKDIVERNGGTIWAESRPGSGSRFSVTLPSYASVS